MTCKTCRFIEHGIYFKQLDNGNITIKHCCNMDSIPENEQPHLQEEYNGGDIDWNKIFENKRKDRDMCRRGEYYDVCKNCWELQEQETDEEDYISHVTLAHLTKCNSRCVYCYIGVNKELHNAPQKYRLLPVLEDMRNKNILRFTGSLRYMGGEPTLLEDFETITNMFVDNNIPEIYLPTSGIKLSKSMVKACSKVPNCCIYISIDSGCKETYKQIKGLDAYDLVLNSLKTYANANIMPEHVTSKYIAVLGINDNKKEIDKWIEESKKAGIKMLAFDVEYSYVYDSKNEKYLKHLSQLRDYAEQRITQAGLKMDKYIPYIQKLQNWVSENKEKIQNDTPKGSISLNITDKTLNDIEESLNKIIEENSIWNKPKIKLNINFIERFTLKKQIEDVKVLCERYGFEVII